MKCENAFCIYQSEGDCILDSVCINSLGMCTECIYPNIAPDILNEAKAKLLQAYQKAECD